jgi:hypothetical protein
MRSFLAYYNTSVFIILTHILAFVGWQAANGTAKFYFNSGQTHHSKTPPVIAALQWYCIRWYRVQNITLEGIYTKKPLHTEP